MKTSQIFVTTTLVAILGLSFFISTAEACSCMPMHSQEYYCRADYGKKTIKIENKNKAINLLQ